MSPLALPILGVIEKIFDRVLPDPVKQAEMKLEVLKMEQAGEFKQLEFELAQMTGQLEVNKAEASNSSVFVSGWRPFIGWTCGAGFAMQFVAGPLLTWGSRLAGHPLDFPPLDLEMMMPMLFGMLGLGAYRTYEKTKKVA